MVDFSVLSFKLRFHQGANGDPGQQGMPGEMGMKASAFHSENELNPKIT